MCQIMTSDIYISKNIFITESLVLSDLFSALCINEVYNANKEFFLYLNQ